MKTVAFEAARAQARAVLTHGERQASLQRVKESIAIVMECGEEQQRQRDADLSHSADEIGEDSGRRGRRDLR